MMKRERLTITLRRDLLRHIDETIDGNTVRNRSHAIEKILVEKFGDTFFRKAVILGGGEGIIVDGVRTSPLVARVDGVTMVERHIRMLKEFGVTNIILAVGAFGDDVRAIVGDGAALDVRVMYVEHDHGTASVLRQARSVLNEPFVMFNGHIITQGVDLADMFVFHKNTKALATVAVTTVADPSSYGVLRMRGNRVVAFGEDADGAAAHLVNAGMYILEPEVCSLVRPEEESLERDVFPQIIAQKKMYGYLLDTPWQRVK